MQNGDHLHQTECLECETVPQERLNYFTGQFLVERDFRDEQSYHIGKHRMHNRYLHGWGTVCGLRVVESESPDCRDRYMVLEPGVALDCCGREIVVTERVKVNIPAMLAPSNDQGNPQGVQHLVLSIRYTECKTEYVPALYSDCGCDDKVCDANRIREGYELRLERRAELPKPCTCSEGCAPEAGGLEWHSTINLDDARRVRIDVGAGRIYVLTGKGQVMAYDLEHGALQRSIDLNALGHDFAIAPNGGFLYVVASAQATPDTYFLGVIDIQDIANPTQANTVPIGQAQAVPTLVVSPDGRVFVHDRAAHEVTIFSTAVNSGGANQVYGTATTGNDARSIALSPDGAWLFVAEGTDAAVRAVNVATLQSKMIAMPNTTPVLLAGGGTAARMFVATAEGKLHAFSVTEDAANPFPAFGSPAGFGGGVPVDLAASSDGGWAYVLADVAGTGSVRAISAGRLLTDPTKAVTATIDVVRGPRHLLVDADGSHLYAAGAGINGGGGGVSVIDVKDSSCADILWRGLDGCPACCECDDWVVLAAVHDYKQGEFITNDRIDNRIRRMVVSTDLLRQAILCALENSTKGKKGDQGPPGADGQDGKDGKDGLPGTNGTNGKDGLGLETDLVRIRAVSWQHATTPNALLSIPLLNPPPGGPQALPGVAIIFTDQVHVKDGPQPVTAGHTFEVLVEDTGTQRASYLTCRCSVNGLVVPVTWVEQNGVIQWDTVKEAPGATASGVAFLLPPQFADTGFGGNEFWVRLRGDFVIDLKGRAVDANFVRAEFPTGDHPAGADYGIQGGLFESWFWRSNIVASGKGLGAAQGAATQREGKQAGGTKQAAGTKDGGKASGGGRSDRSRKSSPMID